MVDSGAMSSFIDINFVKTHGLPLFTRDHPVEIHTVDGRPISSGLVTHESRLGLTIGQHSEKITLDVTALGITRSY